MEQTQKMCHKYSAERDVADKIPQNLVCFSRAFTLDNGFTLTQFKHMKHNFIKFGIEK